MIADGFSVGDQKDLLVGLLLPGQQASRHLQSLPGVGVVGTRLDVGELRQHHLLGPGLRKESPPGDPWGICSWISSVRASATFFRRGDAVFTVQHHGMADVDRHDGGAGGEVLGLEDLEIAFAEVDRAEVSVQRILDRAHHIDLMEIVTKSIGDGSREGARTPSPAERIGWYPVPPRVS